MWFITGEDENFDICVLTPSPGNLSLQHKYAAKWVTPLRCFQMAVGNLASLECGQKNSKGLRKEGETAWKMFG